jgi:hypothetical protein
MQLEEFLLLTGVGRIIKLQALELFFLDVIGVGIGDVTYGVLFDGVGGGFGVVVGVWSNRVEAMTVLVFLRVSVVLVIRAGS